MVGKLVQNCRASRCQEYVIAGITLVAGICPVSASVVIDFEELSLPAESFYNGSDGAGVFTSGGAFFNNTYTDFGGGFYAWTGWSYSNMTDVTTPGFDNQYSAITGGGAEGSSNYAVAFVSAPGDATIECPVCKMQFRVAWVKKGFPRIRGPVWEHNKKLAEEIKKKKGVK